MALHRDLTGADLHEPKGADSAGAGDVYVFDGSGSGTPKKIGLDSLNTSTLQNPNTIYLTTILEDISDTSVVVVPAPAKSTFDSASIILGGSISDAPAGISFSRNGVDSFGTPVSVVVAGSGEGVHYTFTPTSNRDLVDGNYIKISSNGASTGAVRLFLTLKFTRTF